VPASRAPRRHATLAGERVPLRPGRALAHRHRCHGGGRHAQQSCTLCVSVWEEWPAAAGGRRTGSAVCRSVPDRRPPVGRIARQRLPWSLATPLCQGHVATGSASAAAPNASYHLRRRPETTARSGSRWPVWGCPGQLLCPTYSTNRAALRVLAGESRRFVARRGARAAPQRQGPPRRAAVGALYQRSETCRARPQASPHGHPPPGGAGPRRRRRFPPRPGGPAQRAPQRPRRRPPSARWPPRRG
jgi:hypothetical protein